MNTRIPMISAALFAAFTGITQADSEVMNFAAWSQQASIQSAAKSGAAGTRGSHGSSKAALLQECPACRVTTRVWPVPTGQGNTTTLTEYRYECTKSGRTTAQTWAY